MKRALVVSNSRNKVPITDILSASVKNNFEIRRTDDFDIAQLLLLRRYDLEKANAQVHEKIDVPTGWSIRRVGEEHGHLNILFKTDEGKEISSSSASGLSEAILASVTTLEESCVLPPYDVVLVDENLTLRIGGITQVPYLGFVIKGLAEIARVPKIGIRVTSLRHKRLHGIHFDHGKRLLALCFTTEQMRNGHGPCLEKRLFGA